MQGKNLRESIPLVPLNCILSLYLTQTPLLLLAPPYLCALFMLQTTVTTESWVEVPQHQQEGALVHSQSKEKMEELLAAAVSEKEEEEEGQTSPKL